MLRPVRLACQSLSRATPTQRRGPHGNNVLTTAQESVRRSVVSAPQLPPRVPEEFFLPPNSNHCRLCGEVQLRGVPHTGSSVHQLLESITWLLVTRAKRHPSGAVGVAPEASRVFFLEEAQRWERVLRHFCCFPLTQHMSAFSGGEATEEISAESYLSDVASESLWRHLVQRKASLLRDKLHVLMELGVLNVTAPRGGKTDTGMFQRDAGFQRLECIGDHNWGHSVCHRLIVLFPEVNWRTLSNVFVVDALRTVLESNNHLDYVFTVLQLDDLLGSCESQGKSTKFKADVVEAIAGELHVALWSLEPYDTDGISTRPSLHGVPATPPLAIFVRSCLNELLDTIFYSFIAKYNVQLVRTVVALSRREEYIMDSSSSPFYALRGSRRRRLGTTGSPRWILPSHPRLHQELQPRGGRPITHVTFSCAKPPASLAAIDAGYEKGAVPTDGLLQEVERPMKAAAERHITRLIARELIDRCGVLDCFYGTVVKDG
ncbi:RNA editing complex protein [Trypanosoma conorhini]|uniref:RNA editing complex protein n=1 Tax=Trypanosoma conorhini TaxID=83891 RepID=A0A422P6T2_9TRYP|nr:RNA editing complex protein [Trypanosoma conorhini]RNF13401.1 RNA editing complex protein [Trypanosoma conorhini]